MIAMFAVLVVVAWLSLRANSRDPASAPVQHNPAELKPALVFGFLYAAILVVIAAANRHFGNEGLYIAAVISGLTDMDAITLSISQLVNSSQIESFTGWRLIIVAAMANLAFKAATVGFLGSRKLFVRVFAGFAAAAGMGTALLIFWKS